MTQLGRYEILQQLATSAVADVLLARAKGLEGFTRHVVIKQIRSELALDERFVKAFLDEARIGASLHHQNIVQVYDIDEDHGAYYFTMEYVHGEDVRKLLLRVRELDALVPIDQVVTIGAAAAAGLHHAHEQVGPDRLPLGLVHRDVSPGNILIGFDGSVKLVDFGLAKPALKSVKTRTGAISGKAPYMSPELCCGKPIDRRSDIFALGIVLYELATARRLFKGDNDYMTMAAIVEGEIAPPSTHRPEIPRALDEIIMRALAKTPEARYQTAFDLRAALEGFAIDKELRTTSKAMADYMVRLFGARSEPWQLDAPTSSGRALDSEGDFDESSVGLVAAPAGSADRIARMAPDSVSPIALARKLAEHEETAPVKPEHVAARAPSARLSNPIVDDDDADDDDDAAPTRIDMSPEDEETMTVTSTSTSTTMMSNTMATALSGASTVTETVRDPEPPVYASTTLPSAGAPRVALPKKLPPMPRGASTSPPPRPSQPALAKAAPALPLSPRIAAGPQMLGAPPRVLGSSPQPVTPPRADAADEATTVTPPLFEQPEPVLPPVMPEAVYVPPPPPVKPPWMRYLTLVLWFAIPMAVGLGTRSCSQPPASENIGTP